jgi:glucose/mannose-6-phosphate isomerase
MTGREPPAPDYLDRDETYALDADGMLEHAAAVGRQLVQAWNASARVHLPWDPGGFHAIAVLGIGGSATAGDYFAAIASPSAPFPVAVVQGYEVPAWLGRGTLAVACSYSGNTPETLAAVEAASERGAAIAAITGGGELAARAEAHGWPLFRVGYRASPRATTVHSLAPLLRIGLHFRLVDVDDSDIANAAAAHGDMVQRLLAHTVPREQNPAKECAHALWGKTPIVLGAGHLEPAAVRFKNQLAENGKALAVVDFIPQAGHNLVVGLTTASPDRFVVLVFGSRLLSRAVLGRAAAIAAEFERAGIEVQGLPLYGGSILVDLLQATAWGDFVSCYLALLNGQDPTPVAQIDRVRAWASD